MPELVVNNFERGITDNYVSGPKNAGQKYDNLLISSNRKPFQRSGSELYDSSLTIIPAGNQRIQASKLFGEVLFEFSGDEIFYRDTTFKELVGPVDSYDAFGDVGSASVNHNSMTEWQNHLYTSIDEYGLSRKIYKDEAGVWQIRTNGLPSIGDVRALQTSITLANYLKGIYNAHVNDVVIHKLTSTNVTAPNATDLATLITLCNQMKDLYVAHEADARIAVPLKHQAQIVLNDSLDDANDIFTLDGAVAFLNAFKTKYQTHDSRVTAHTTANLHQPSGAVAATRDFVVTAESGDGKAYLYALLYKYQYNVGTVTYIDRSDVTEVLISNGGDFSTTAHGNDLSLIPVLTNTLFGTKEAWDTVNITIEVYRTTNDGVVLQKVDEIANGSTTYEDDTNDTTLSANGETIYTDGDVLGNEIPPQCKYIIQANNIMYYLNVKEGVEEKPYRIRHSFPFIPHGCPSDFAVDIDGDISGGGVIGIYPIVFTRNKIYRLEGQVDSTGVGVIQARIVNNTVGTISHNSIVPVNDGLFFAAKDGFYFTDGFRAVKLTQHLNNSYKSLVLSETQQKRIYGAYDKITNRVYWAVQRDSSSSENDGLWIHDPNWGLPNNEGTYTTWNFDASLSKPTALEFDEGSLIRSDSAGYTFIHDESLTTDPIVDTSVSASLWNTTAVIFDYISCAYDFDSFYQRKWVTKLLTLLKAVTNISLQPKSINDDSGASMELKEYRSRSLFEWGDPFFEWGDPDFIWNAPSTNIAIRRFPRNGLRCTLKQVEYTNSNTIIMNSDNFGTVTASGAANTITIDSGEFSSDQAGNTIYFNDSDNGFLIISATDTVLTVSDPFNLLVDGVYDDWVVRGVRKGEIFHLENYTIVYDYFGPSHTYYRVGDSGENV